jgi:RNA polymerase sigma-70 factor (ECF subfamily)
MADDAPESLTRPSLLRRIRDPGDTEAWQVFVDVYGPLIYRHARSKGLQDADATEVTQEVLLQVCRSIQQFEYSPERGRFRDWLGTVTQNKIRRFLHKEAGVVHPRAEGPEEDPLAGVAAPARDTQWSEDFHRHLLQLALVRVRPHFEEPVWRAFEMVWRDDQVPAAVARELGQRVDWVYLAKSRVLKRLQDEIRQLAEDVPMFLQ